MESISDGVCCNGVSDISSLQFVTSTSNGSSGGCQIGLAVAEMSCLEYAFGEGYNPVLDSSKFKICALFSFFLNLVILNEIICATYLEEKAHIIGLLFTPLINA